MSKDLFDVGLLAKITGKAPSDNSRSVVAGLRAYGVAAGLDKPHRLAHYLAQILHESGAFRYDGEIWGPTPAQKRYDTREDLGNTKALDGDGEKYKGRGPIQITGKGNYRQFRDWCRQQGLEPPDFVERPELVNTDPWEGLGPIWYWQTRNLNAYADANDIEMVTRKINGGINGLADRISWYVKAALVLLDYPPAAVRAFQVDAQARGLIPPVPDQLDGIAGPKTRAALHLTLAEQASRSVPVKAAPVMQTVETEVPVVPETVEKQVSKKFSLFGWLGGIISGGGLSLAGLAGMDWQAIVAIGGVLLVVFVVALILRSQIVAAIKEIRKAVEDV